VQRSEWSCVGAWSLLGTCLGCRVEGDKTQGGRRKARRCGLLAEGLPKPRQPHSDWERKPYRNKGVWFGWGSRGHSAIFLCRRPPPPLNAHPRKSLRNHCGQRIQLSTPQSRGCTASAKGLAAWVQPRHGGTVVRDTPSCHPQGLLVRPSPGGTFHLLPHDHRSLQTTPCPTPGPMYRLVPVLWRLVLPRLAQPGWPAEQVAPLHHCCMAFPCVTCTFGFLSSELHLESRHLACCSLQLPGTCTGQPHTDTDQGLLLILVFHLL
jgi:hypothetical protein